MKEFADDNFKFDENGGDLSKRVKHQTIIKTSLFENILAYCATK